MVGETHHTRRAAAYPIWLDKDDDQQLLRKARGLTPHHSAPGSINGELDALRGAGLGRAVYGGGLQDVAAGGQSAQV